MDALTKMKLNRITSLAAFVLNCDYNTLIHPYKDSDSKIFCALLADTELKLSNRVLAKFYKINPGYLVKRSEMMAEKILINDSLWMKFEKAKSIWDQTLVENA